MKKGIITTVAIVLTMTVCCSSRTKTSKSFINFSEEKPKLITIWSESVSDGKKVVGKLTCRDEISVGFAQTGVDVTIYHKKVGNIITSVEAGYVEVYEYDFDNDGQEEIMVFSAPSLDDFLLTVQVFRYSNGLLEKVGKFQELTKEFILKKNRFSYIFGGAFLRSRDYIYEDGSFFELVYHDPNAEDFEEILY